MSLEAQADLMGYFDQYDPISLSCKIDWLYFRWLMVEIISTLDRLTDLESGASITRKLLKRLQIGLFHSCYIPLKHHYEPLDDATDRKYYGLGQLLRMTVIDQEVYEGQNDHFVLMNEIDISLSIGNLFDGISRYELDSYRSLIPERKLRCYRVIGEYLSEL